ncbi:COG4223 family protein [Peteryoungia ipomoeae]|uniref:Uncharacterized protein n=1 Tax=Peteryoungia ipomoeae TaxID=1210932 RepID=A0A4S8NXH6_9HYPH|nr:COG4223 family protein [Peteryoungia ipomoeae]THV22383.1 hypothetical protein FAA97_13955 [Peteryoungia ipomoeae]
MVSGKPPRRSKAPQEPVTIDLKADEARSGAETETAADAATAPLDDSVAPLDANPQSNGPNQEDPQSEKDSVTTEDIGAAGIGGDGTPLERDAAQASAPSPETPPSEAAAREPAAPIPSTQRSGPSTSTLVASGILGGLVALALAGSMQYAGVLPSMGPEDVSTQTPAPATEDLAILRSEVEQLSAKLASLPSDPATEDPKLQERLAALENSVAAQANQPAPQPDTAALDALRAQLNSANQAIAALRTEIEQNRTSLEDSNQRLADAEKRLEEPRNDVEMARAIALAGLKTAIDRGGPFLSELEALRSIAPEDPTVQALSGIAKAGVPSRVDLSRDFAPVADDILAAIHAPAEGESWSDRLLSSARSLVKVRPIGNVEGDTPEALVARIEDKLKNGDVKGAHLEWQALPEAGKTASQAFAEKLDARIKAEEAVSQALAQTVAGREG